MDWIFFRVFTPWIRAGKSYHNRYPCGLARALRSRRVSYKAWLARPCSNSMPRRLSFAKEISFFFLTQLRPGGLPREPRAEPRVMARILRGQVLALFAFDIGYEVSLE